MKPRLLIIIGVFALVLIPVATKSSAEEIKIKFGETVHYEDLDMYFYDVEDSRCPLDVTCLWEGKVSAMIHTSNQTHKIGGGFEIGYPLTYITPYTITLIDVQPHPISTEKPDYVAILDISKIEPEPEPTPQVKALCESPEVILVDGVCQKIIAEEPIEFFTAEQPPEWLWFVIGGLFMLGMILLIWKKRK